MLVKVINGCGLNDRFWVYAAGTTDVAWTMTVMDHETGETFTRSNPLGQPSPAITASDAFDTGP